MYYNLMCVRIATTSLLIAYLLRDLWDAIFIGYLLVRRYNSVTSFSIAYPVVFQYRCLCHMACVEFTLVALVCSHCTCLIGVDVRRPDCHADASCRERGLHFVGCSFQPFDRDSVTLLHCGLELELRPRDCWFIIELIICYILHRYLILSSLSQVLRIIYLCFCVIVMCIYTIT